MRISNRWNDACPARDHLAGAKPASVMNEVPRYDSQWLRVPSRRHICFCFLDHLVLRKKGIQSQRHGQAVLPIKNPGIQETPGF
jgi:hypothetical protein